MEYKNSKAYSEALKRRLRRAATSKKAAEKIEEYYKATSRKRKFKRLERSTIEQRKRMAGYNTTHSEYSPGRSNLTFSGQLIDSIKAFIRTSKQVIELIPTGRRKPYRLKDGRLSKNRPLNRDVVAGQSDQNRHLMIPTKKQRAGIIEIFRNVILKGIRK